MSFDAMSVIQSYLEHRKENMEFFVAVLVTLVVSFFAVEMRAFKAQDCIDNGKVQFDGYQIEPSEGITNDERAKIENEIRFYVKAKRTFTTLGLRLYPKNSA